MPAHPVYFGPAERALAGWVHLPASGRARGAVLICGPVGREHAACYPTVRMLAEHLAEAGLVALRFDYDGTGDSAGGMGDPDRLAGWLGSVRTALEFLRSTGAPVVSVVGLRLGALLAVTALADEQLFSFVAWDPQLSGRVFLREQSLLAAVGAGPGAAPAAPDGTVHGAGSVFPAELSAQLKALRLAADRLALASHVLIAHRPRDLATLAASELCGPATALLEVHDSERMLEAIPNRPAVATVGEVVGYLDGLHVEAAVTVGVPEHRQEMQARDRGGRSVVERFWRSDDEQLFGIACDPVRGLADGPVTLFFPTGLGHRVGVGNLWVDLARECAAEGMSSVRVDLTGLGDSPARPGRTPGEVLTTAAVDDIVQAARQVSPQEPGNVHLVGHCSSAWAALRAAEVLQPRSVHAVHYLPFAEWTADVWAPSAPASGGLRGLLVRGRRSGLIPGRADVPGWMWVLLDRAGLWPSPMRAIARLVAAGTRVQVLTDDVEAGYFVSVGQRAVQRFPPGMFEIEVMPVRDHGLLASRTRRLVAGSLLSNLRRAHTGRRAAGEHLGGSATT